MVHIKPQEYWFSPKGLYIELNAAGDNNYIYANCSSGAVLICHVRGVEELGFDVGHNYKRWYMVASPTAFHDNRRRYVYIRIPKSDAADAMAEVEFCPEEIDMYGLNEAGQQIGSTEHFYLFTGGIISPSENGGVLQQRFWEQQIVSGTLATDEGLAGELEGTWWRYDPLTDMVTFLKKIAYALFEYIKVDDGEADNWTVHKLLKAYNAYINKVQSTNYTGDGLLDTGWRITNDYEGGNSAATFDYLTIRKKAFFNELEIRKLTSIGGNFCMSPASGKIFQIEWYDAEDTLLGYDYYNVPWTLGARLMGLFSKSLAQRFLGKRKRLARKLSDEEIAAMRRIRCYFYTDDGSTSTMLNWTVGAQARCQTFNIDEQMEHISGGESNNDDVGFYDTDMYGGVDFYRGHKVSNTYYWRLVTAVGKARLDDGKFHYYVEFMVNTGADATHADAGSDLPSIGDQLVQFGHRTRVDQQNVIMIETASTEAPCIKMYEGINSWSLANKMVATMSPKGWKVAAQKFEWMTAYGTIGQTIFRGLWIDIPLDANGKRRCYYNDVVSHNGSYWRCIVNEGTHKENAAMTKWYTQAEIDAMSLEEQLTLIDVPNYTIVEPGDATHEQLAVWQKEVSIGISPYLKFSNGLFAIPCEKDGKTTSAYSQTATVALMVTNLEATITSITMEGQDSHVRLESNKIVVSYNAGVLVTNKDYIITVEGVCNEQKYTATDKISVYAIIRGNDAYEIEALPHNWLWNQRGANYSYEDIMRMIEEGTSPSDFGIEIDGNETGNSSALITCVNAGVAQPFQIVSVTPSDRHITATFSNTSGRVWVTYLPNNIESGYVDVVVRYGNNALRTVRIPFWCNLLGTWREIILGDTRASIAEKTEYYDSENKKAKSEYEAKLNNAKNELNDVIAANEEARDQTDAIMKDGLITDDEKAILRSIKKSLQTEYNEAVQAYAPVYDNVHLKDTKEKANLYSAKSQMASAYTAVINKIDQLLALTKIDKNGADQVNATFNTFDSKLQAYRRALEAAAGKISGNAAAAAAATAKSELNDIIKANETARDKTDEIMKDGLITDDEKTVLRSLRKTLATEYNEAVAAYAPVYNDANLTGTTEKTTLATAKSEMASAYTAVINKIDQLLALTKIDKNGADQVNATFNTFDSKLQAYRRALEAASNKIINVGDSKLNTLYTDFRGEYLQSSKENSARFSAISGALTITGYDSDGLPIYEKSISREEYGNYKQSAFESISEIERRTKTSNTVAVSINSAASWERKNTNENTGYTYEQDKTTSTSRIATKQLVRVSPGCSISFKSAVTAVGSYPIQIGISYFDENGLSLGDWSGWQYFSKADDDSYVRGFTVGNSCYYVGVVARLANNGTIYTTLADSMKLVVSNNDWVESSYSNQYADKITMGVKNGLSDTGIDITNHQIKLRANNVQFCDSNNNAKTYVEITSDGKIKATDGEFTGNIYANGGSIGGFIVENSYDLFGYNSSLYLKGNGSRELYNITNCGATCLNGLKFMESEYSGYSIISDSDSSTRAYKIYQQSSILMPSGGTLKLPKWPPTGWIFFVIPFKSPKIEVADKTTQRIYKANGDLDTEGSSSEENRKMIFIKVGDIVNNGTTYHDCWAEFYCG